MVFSNFHKFLLQVHTTNGQLLIPNLRWITHAEVALSYLMSQKLLSASVPGLCCAESEGHQRAEALVEVLHVWRHVERQAEVQGIYWGMGGGYIIN